MIQSDGSKVERGCYSTYEELKLELDEKRQQISAGRYSTYEELKH